MYRDKNLDEIELVYLNKINNAASSKEGQEWSEQLIKYKEQKRKEKNNEYQNKFSIFAFITGLIIFGNSSLSGNLVFSLSTMSFGGFISGAGLYRIARAYVDKNTQYVVSNLPNNESNE